MILWGAYLWERWALFSGFTGLSFHWVSCHHHPLPCKPAGRQAESEMSLPNYSCALHIPYTSLFPGCVEAGCLLTVRTQWPWAREGLGAAPSPHWVNRADPDAVGYAGGQGPMVKMTGSSWVKMGMWHLLCARHSAGISDSMGDLIPSCISSVQLLSRVRLFATPWTSARQASLSITNSRSPPKLNVHRVGDAIQPSHPLSSPSPPALNLSQHQGFFKWVSSSHQVVEVLEFQLQHQSFQRTPRTDLL